MMKRKMISAALTFGLAASMTLNAPAAMINFGDLLEAETAEAEGLTEENLEEETVQSVIKGGSSVGEDILNILQPEEEEEEGYKIALDDLNISIRVEDFTAMRQDEDGFVYIYTGTDGSIPYVILGSYDVEYEKVVDGFTGLMQKTYSDLDVDFLYEGLEIGDLEFTKVIYRYKISGYDACDTRLFCDYMGTSYMFGMKEVEDLEFTVGEDYLEAVAGSIEILAGGYSDYEYHVDAEHELLFEDIEQGGEIPEETTGEDIEDGRIFDEEDAPYEGVWIPFEDGFRLYLPTDWNWIDLTAEMTQAGVICAAGDATVGDPMPMINVSVANDDSVDSLEQIADLIEQNGYIVEDIDFVNDIECIIYTSGDDSIRGEMFLYPLDEESGYFFALVANNYSRDTETFDSILLSLSRAEEE